jgi:hypothetical protein
MDYETKRRIKVLASMLGFCVVFLAVVLLSGYGFFQMRGQEKIQSSKDSTPLDVGKNNRERKNILEDAGHD